MHWYNHRYRGKLPQKVGRTTVYEILDDIMKEIDNINQTADYLRSKINEIENVANNLQQYVNTVQNHVNNTSNPHQVTFQQLLNKPNTYPPDPHTHPWSDITGKPTDYPTSWNKVSGKPNTYPPANHNHDSRYVNVNGDTISGSLKIENGDITLGNKADEALFGMDFNGVRRFIAQVNDVVEFGTQTNSKPTKINGQYIEFDTNDVRVQGQEIWHKGNTTVDANGFIKQK